MPCRVLLTRYLVPLLGGTSRKVALNLSVACLVPKVPLAPQEHQDPQEWWEEWVFLVKMARMARTETGGTLEKKVHLAGQVTVENKDQRAKLGPLGGLALEDPRGSAVPQGSMAHQAKRDLKARKGNLGCQAPAAAVVAGPSRPFQWR